MKQFVTGDDDGNNIGDRLRLTLARLEEISSTIGVFLHQLYTENPITGPTITTFQHGASDDDHLLLPRRSGTTIDLETAGANPAAAAGSSFPNADIARLHCLVIHIRRAVAASDVAEVHGKRWLAEWRRELQDVADRADRVLLELSTAVPSPDPAETLAYIVQVRRPAQSLKTEVAHLGDFVMLVRFAVTANALA
ncbi:unnamed protein product [Urochloa humidicola]